MNKNTPLRYSISKWPQAINCLSNNSRDFHIKVDEVINNEKFHGEIVRVEHDKFGTMFAAVTQGEGTIITEGGSTDDIQWMTTDEILIQLAKFGFDIIYKKVLSLDQSVIDYLLKIDSLGYDKINRIELIPRVANVRDIYIIAFKSEENPDLINYNAEVLRKDFDDKLHRSSVISLTNQIVEWDWLDAVYNIKDILEENSNPDDDAYSLI